MNRVTVTAVSFEKLHYIKWVYERLPKSSFMDVVTGGRDCPINSNKHTLQLNTSKKNMHMTSEYATC
jgi:hypothetical protein